MVSDAEQQAAAFFELADNIDGLGRGAGFRQNDCHSARTKRLQNRLPGVLHAETELAHIGKIAGPIFAERTGRADPDKNDLPGLLQHTASVVDALPKGGRVDIKEKVLDSRFAAVYKILALLFQIVTVTQLEMAVAGAAHLFTKSKDRAGGHMGLGSQFLDGHMCDVVLVFGDAVINGVFQFVQAGQHFIVEHKSVPLCHGAAYDISLL